MKRYGMFLVLFFTSIMFFISSCGRDADDTTKDDDMTYDQRDNEVTINDKNHFWTTDRDYTFEQRNEFRQDVNASLARLNQRITELERRAEKSTGDTKEWYNDRADNLKEKRSEIENDMRDYDNMTSDGWDDFKSGVASVWDDIEDSWDDIANDDKYDEDGQY